MMEFWEQRVGQLVNGVLPLQKFLGGDENHAVFLTEYGKKKPQQAAIKLIPDDPRKAENQLQRWRMVEKLAHPHLVRVFESGRCQLGERRLLYVVMDHAEEDLSQVLPNRPLTPTEVREVLDPTLSALAYIHEQGFVHGHLKPSNFMAVEGGLKISSDGLSRLDQKDPVRPDVYAPPEIMSDGLSPAGDVWSLGVTLVEALTQRLPAVAGMQLRDPELPDTLPAFLRDIARNCLRWDPRTRWTVDRIAKRLRDGAPAKPDQKAAESTEGSRKLIYASTIVLAAALAGVAIAPRLRNPRPEAPRAPSVVLESPPVTAKAEPKAPEPEPVAPPVVAPEPVAKEPVVKETAAPPKKVVETPAPPPRTKTTESASSTPGIVQQVLPEVSTHARGTIQGKISVSVRVQVDAAGNVVDARFDKEGPSKYFAPRALEAARTWKFEPSSGTGTREWILLFRFYRNDTKVIPRRVGG